MMNIIEGCKMYLISQDTGPDDLLNALIPELKENVVDKGFRKLEILMPSSFRVNEEVAQSFIGNNKYKVSRMINVSNVLHIFYKRDQYQQATSNANRNVADSVFRGNRP